MNVCKMVARYLEDNGYDGLVGDYNGNHFECCCTIQELKERCPCLDYECEAATREMMEKVEPGIIGIYSTKPAK